MADRKAATRQKLFDATLALIGTKGLAALTVDEVAARAGVAKGTVYYNFGSKDSLIDGLLRHGIDLFAARLADAETATEPAAALELLVDGALSFFADYPTFAQLIASELWRTPGQWHQTLALLRERVTSVFRQVLASLPVSVDAPTAAGALFGTVLVVALDWQVFHPERTREQVRDSVLALVRGLYSGG